MRNSLFYIIILLFSFESFCQSKDESIMLRKTVSSTNVMISNLNKNGIETNGFPLTLDSDEIKKIIYFDFSQYRSYYKKQFVQIANGGPIIELYSIERMIKEGFVFEESFLESKKGIDYSGVIHQTIPIVIVGYGINESQSLK